jgi:EAL domain-containing protein (putative c-di-GMP-specific phosphodiesterase class I)
VPLEQILDLIKPQAGLASGPRGSTLDLILQAIRTHLGMDVAFASRVTPSELVIQNADAHGAAPFAAGDAFPLQDSYCQRVIDGRLPFLIHDASKVPEVAELASTKEMPIGAHISVPLRLSDGSVYGTFCCFSFAADHSLRERDVQMMHAFAGLAAAEIEADLTARGSRDEITSRTRSVIEQNGPNMVFQPIYCLETREIIGVEALARFPDAEARGPDSWFAEAAEVGLAVDLELAAVRAALNALSHLPADTYLAVNVSPETILSGRLYPLLGNIPSGRIVFEVTEHEVVKDFVLLRAALEPLRRQCKIAVDDVGAGYAGLRHILDIRPDVMKLDMSLTRGIDRDPARAALASALIKFGNDIGSTIVAEGIETQRELVTLCSLGAHAGQGYHLRPPRPLSAVMPFLIARGLRASASGPGEDPQPTPMAISDQRKVG